MSANAFMRVGVGGSDYQLRWSHGPIQGVDFPPRCHPACCPRIPHAVWAAPPRYGWHECGGGWHVEANCKVVQWFKYAWSGVPQVQSEYQVRKKVSHIRLARNTCNKLVRDFCLHARVCVMDVGEFVLHRHRHTCICTNERAQQDLNVPLC